VMSALNKSTDESLPNRMRASRLRCVAVGVVLYKWKYVCYDTPTRGYILSHEDKFTKSTYGYSGVFYVCAGSFSYQDGGDVDS
jgi:hypothetical protein